MGQPRPSELGNSCRNLSIVDAIASRCCHGIAAAPRPAPGGVPCFALASLGARAHGSRFRNDGEVLDCVFSAFPFRAAAYAARSALAAMSEATGNPHCILY